MKTISPMKNQQTKVPSSKMPLQANIRNWERSERQKSIKMSRKLSRKNKALRMAIGA